MKPAVTVDSFDGLQVSSPAAQVGADAAVDLLDVDWDTRGVLGSRIGASKFTTKDPGANYDVIFGADIEFLPFGDHAALLARRGEVLVRINEKGEEEGGTLEVTTGRLNFCNMGLAALTPTTYIANQDKPIRKFDGEGFSSPTATVDGVAGKAMPEAHFVAAWPDGGNRLVSANTTLEGGPAAAAGSPSHVFFSEPGQPEHYESTSYVQLTPGDGEQIMGIASWGRQVFVFKETRVFVFYGVSADEEGKPIFNYTTIELGTRAVSPRGSGAPHIVVGREGVYFVAKDGIWVTTGGTPTLVTQSLDFSRVRRDPLAELGGKTIPSWSHVKGLCYSGECLYVGLQAGQDEEVKPIERMFKIDLRSGRVTYWKTMLNAFTSWAPVYYGDDIERVFFSGSGEANEGVFFYTPAAEDDPTVEMDPYWLSGFYSAGEDVDEETLTQMKVWGTGNVDIALAEDYGAVDTANAKEFKLGVAPAIAQRQHQRGQSATLFAHKISGKGPWSVQRLTRYLRETREPATQKP